jgi:SAM-dependent methyltransferase
VNDFDKYAEARPALGDEPSPLPSLELELRKVHGTFLEIGCGDGLRLKSLNESGLLSVFESVIALDISQVRIARAARAVPSARFAVSSALSVPMSSASVDFVFSDQVIEHVPDDSAMAREILRVLKPGGTAYVGSVMKRPWAWYIYRVDGNWRLDPTHLREYLSTDEYRSVFTQAGLEVRAVYTLPVSYRSSDLVLRVLKVAFGWDGDRCTELNQHNPVLRLLKRLSIRIPGYYFCYALTRRRMAQSLP